MNNHAEDGVIVIGKKAKIAELGEIHARLVRALSDKIDIEINCAAIEEIDLSFIQLLIATQKAAAQSGATLRLSSPAPSAVMRLLERGGFISGLGERSADAAFWMAREGQ